MLCVFWNKKTRKGFFPSELCRGTNHFNIKQSDKAEKVTTWSFLDAQGWRRSCSCVQAGWSCTGGLSSIPQYRAHSLFSYNFILSRFIHMIGQHPAPAHSWSIGQSCQPLGFPWGAGWGWELWSVSQWYKEWNPQPGASSGVTNCSTWFPLLFALFTGLSSLLGGIGDKKSA